MIRRYRNRKRRLLSDYLPVTIVFLAVAFAAAWFEDRNREVISAQFAVVDGDSLRQGERRIRLVGIDAPELAQICTAPDGEYPCGKQARDYLKRIADGAVIQCYSEGTDKYGRTLAECYSGETSLNAQLVAAGWAVSYGGFGRYENEAHTAKRGLWAGTFDLPQDWRAIHSAVEETAGGRLWRTVWRGIKSRFVKQEVEE